MVLNRKCVHFLILAFGFISASPTDKVSGPACISSCDTTSSGYYPSCSGCQNYASCSDGVFVQMTCPENQAWEDTSKTCTHKEFEKCRHNGGILKSDGNSSSDSLSPSFSSFELFARDLHREFKQWLYDKNVNSEMDKGRVDDKMEMELKDLPHHESRVPDIPETGSGEGDLSLIGPKILPSSGSEIKLSPTEALSEFPVGDPKILNKLNNVNKPRLSLSTGPSEGMEELRHRLKETNSKHNRSKKAEKHYNKIAGDCFFRPTGSVTTFDQHKLSLAGECRYVATKLCNSSDFYVEVKMKTCQHGASTVACVDYVDVHVSTNWARLLSFGVAFADGIVVPPGRSETNKQFTVKTEAEYCQLETADGMVATVDRKNRFFLFLPESYSGRVCGLCGNLNGDPSDDAAVTSSVFDYSISNVPEQHRSCAEQFAPKKRQSDIISNAHVRQ